jgi:uncharacterized protein (DUF1015 family)
VAVIRPFQAIRYDPDRVDLAKVTAPPYDVIGPEEQAHYYREDPRNVVRLIAGVVKADDKPEDNKYTRAANFFNDWLSSGVLFQEPEPCVYIYRESFTHPTTGERLARTGLLAAVELRRFGDGVLAHERTHTRPKQDRLSLTSAVKANLSPVFAMYEDAKTGLRQTLDRATSSGAELTIELGERGFHEVWRLSSPDDIRTVANALEDSVLTIADGHHRYETALNYRDKMQSFHPQAPADAAFNFVLMYLADVADPNLLILPTHRLVHGLADFNPDRLLKAVSSRFKVEPHRNVKTLFDYLDNEETANHRLGLLLKGRHPVTLERARDDSADPVSRLDVTILHREVIENELGLHEGLIEDERHVAYTRDPNLVARQVERGEAQAGFLLRPPAVADVVTVAKAGQVMPQKSTYFFPKPLSGIVFNPLYPDLRITADFHDARNPAGHFA